MADPARFLRLFFRITLGALALTFATNLLVDPLGLFGMPTWEGFNAEKTQYQKYLRLAKPHAVRMQKPGALILGTSRAENVDPDHPGWRPEALPAYNMAIQSSRIHEVLLNLQHARAQRRLAQVVLFLDDFMFDPRTRSETGFDPARLDRTAAPGINTAWIGDLVMALLSYDALAESVLTVARQNDRMPVIYQANGAHAHERFQSAVDSKGGHRRLFLDQVKPAGRAFRGDDSAPWRDFRALLDFCRQQDIDLRLAINPMHAHMLELYWLNGSWDRLEAWKRRLVRTLTEEATDARAEPFPLWDFADYNSITTESLPPLGDARSRMRWYWESSHYKAATGQLMLDRLFAVPGAPADFGVRLGRDDLERHLRAIQERHRHHAAGHAADIAEMAALLAVASASPR